MESRKLKSKFRMKGESRNLSNQNQKRYFSFPDFYFLFLPLVFCLSNFLFCNDPLLDELRRIALINPERLQIIRCH